MIDQETDFHVIRPINQPTAATSAHAIHQNEQKKSLCFLCQKQCQTVNHDVYCKMFINSKGHFAFP